MVGIKQLARQLEVSRQALKKFERTQVPAERVVAVARSTGWRVLPHELRPDLYPNRSDAVPDGVVIGIGGSRSCALQSGYTGALNPASFDLGVSV